MDKPTISLLIGNYNNGYCLELCIKSFVKHNGIPDEIVVSDNTSNDFSLNFINNLPYKDKIKIVKYVNKHYDEMIRGHKPFFRYIHIGLNNCRNKWALLTHVDVNWKSNVIDKFYSILNENPNLFMTGIGGGNPNDPSSIRHDKNCMTRFHEWLLFLNVPEWKSFGVSFEGHWNNNIFYDTGCWLYKNAYNAGKKLITFHEQESDGPYITNFVASSRNKKEDDSLRAKEILEKEYCPYEQTSN
jgi:hypothetical protein